MHWPFFYFIWSGIPFSIFLFPISPIHNSVLVFNLNSKVLSNAILGIDAYIVEVECHITGSKLPNFITVGLPEGAVKESKERVTAAIQNSGFRIPGPFRIWRV